MNLKELCSYLDSVVPLSFQESYDNSGLQAGDPENEITCALLTIDVTEDVVHEAVRTGCNIIISHHPLIFGGIKKVTPATSAGSILFDCIKNGIAVYSAHTNLDIAHGGVSRKMAEKLGLKNIKVLQPLENQLLKLVTFIPVSHLDRVRDAVFEAGAGFIGNYDSCGFTVQGLGSFRGNENANPFAGEKGKLHYEEEVRFETVLFSYMKEKVVKALLSSHPYEEVAYDLYRLENMNVDAGLGCTGELPESIDEKTFLEKTADVFGSRGLRYSNFTGKKISKVAVCGGAGSSLLRNAVASGADAFITADIKYHTFFDAEGKILLIDAGHFETEKFASELLKELIIKKFPKFALRFSETRTNPINYL
ncbi:MAG TPA: Nif3-like dinuclear metal center hexameric protein [Bacteroidales bacterium]|nr:Nif3-like dinuclear metal center hexameric protein [Bacteroidales bacterium]